MYNYYCVNRTRHLKRWQNIFYLIIIIFLILISLPSGNLLFEIYFKLNVYFAIIIDLHVVTRNNMEKSNLPFIFPKVISCKSIGQYQNQDIIKFAYLDFPSFICIHLYVHVSIYLYKTSSDVYSFCPPK